jgi:hypothetical protein
MGRGLRVRVVALEFTREYETGPHRHYHRPACWQ